MSSSPPRSSLQRRSGGSLLPARRSPGACSGGSLLPARSSLRACSGGSLLPTVALLLCCAACTREAGPASARPPAPAAGQELFAPNARIAALAARIDAGGEPATRALALYSLLWRSLEEAGVARDTTNRPRADEPRSAGELALALPGSGTPAGATAPASCLELAALYVATARAAGLPAAVAERRDAGAGAGGGQVGHVVAQVSLPGGGRSLVDLANGTTAPRGRFVELSDDEATGLHRNQRAAALVLRGELVAAEAEASAAAALAPASAPPLLTRAAARELLGRIPEALADARRARELSPSPFAGATVGRLLLRSGDPAGAIAELEAAISGAPSLAIAHLSLGRARCAAGEAAKAEAELAAAAVLEPAMWEAARDAALLALARGSPESVARHAAGGRRAAPGLEPLWAGLEQAARAPTAPLPALVSAASAELGACARR